MRQIRDFYNTKMKEENYGMIGSALLLSIDAEFQNYFQAVAAASIDAQSTDHSLRSLFIMFTTWATKLKFLGYLVYNLKDDKKGGEILTGKVSMDLSYLKND